MNKSGPASPTQRPRGGGGSSSSSEKNGMHAVLDAALGLTSLGAPSPTTTATSTPHRSFTTPTIKDEAQQEVGAGATTSRIVTHDVCKPSMLLMDSSILRSMPGGGSRGGLNTIIKPPTILNKETMAAAAAASSLGLPPLHHHHHPIGGTALPPSYSMNHLSDAAMTIDRFSVSERVAMMDRAAALASAATGGGASGHRHPNGATSSAAADAVLMAGGGYPYHPAALSSNFPHQMTLHGTTTTFAPPSASPMAVVNNPYDHHDHEPNPEDQISKTFPELLLEVMSESTNAHIVSWLPHGKGFIVHDKQRFTDYILPKYFDGAKFTSFTRRLKRWSFVRVPRGPELGAYYNKNFQRDRPELMEKMRYKKEGGGGGGGSQFDKATAANKTKKKQQQVQVNNSRLNKISEDVTMGEEKVPQENQAVNEMPNKNKVHDLAESSNHHPILRSHILADSQISPEVKQYFQGGNRIQENAMPLPSMLPKKRYKNTGPLVSTGPLASAGGATLEQRLVNASTSELNSALMLAQAEALHRASTSSTSGNSTAASSFAVPSNREEEERRLMEMQRELLLARSMLAHGGGGGGGRYHPTGSAAAAGYGLPADATTSRMLYNHRQGMTSTTSPRSHHHHNMIDHAVRDFSMRLAPPFLPSSRQQQASPSSLEEELRRHTTTTTATAGVPPPRQRSGSVVGFTTTTANTSQRAGEVTASEHSSTNASPRAEDAPRLVMMTREDEESFAQYLAEKKRKESVGSSNGNNSETVAAV